jgi:tRNA dimethylallyltransferase
VIEAAPSTSVPLLVIVGPTAAGKSALGVRLARELGGEVISADSMQVYRGFDIGTGKVTTAEREGVPHHLIDVVEPDDRYSAARFVEHAEPLIAELAARQRQPVIVGGTGLYVRALLHGLFPTPEVDPALRERLEAERERDGVAALHQRLARVDPETASSVDAHDFVRIARALEIFEQTGQPASALRRAHAFRPWRHPALLVGLRLSPERLRERIEARVDAMLEAGWLDEVTRLCQAGHGRSHPMGALGYRQLAEHLRGGLSYDEAVRLTKRDTRRFARRQRNWFSQEDGVIWFDEPFSAIDTEGLSRRLLARREAPGRGEGEAP